MLSLPQAIYAVLRASSEACDGVVEGFEFLALLKVSTPSATFFSEAKKILREFDFDVSCPKKPSHSQPRGLHQISSREGTSRIKIQLSIVFSANSASSRLIFLECGTSLESTNGGYQGCGPSSSIQTKFGIILAVLITEFLGLLD